MARPSMFFPHMTSSRDPVWMITSGTLITLPKPIFKNLKREDRQASYIQNPLFLADFSQLPS
jgi:hypothetical protein